MVKGVSIETVQGLMQTDYKSAKNTLFQTVMFECMRVRGVADNTCWLRS
jgi:hypothetical protein